jgi:hypothetical protein
MLPCAAFKGQPLMAMANTASDPTASNADLNEGVQSVEDGIYQAGGVPLNLPLTSRGNPGPADPNAVVHWRPWQPRKLRRIPSTTKHLGPLGDLPAIVVAGVPFQIKRKKNHETEDDFP